MTFSSIADVIKKGEGEVSIRGWAYRERGSSKFKFIVLRDSSDIIQCVIKKEAVGEEQFAIADKIQVETSMELKGKLRKDARSPGGYELEVSEFKVVGWSDKFPINKDQSIEHLADNRHLWLRSQRMTSILKIRSTIFGAFHEFFRSKGFYEYQSPMFMGMQCEGGSTLFKVDYFGKPLYLAQTWQLHAEPAVLALEKIYTLAPSFRAEKSKTSRHLTEYWHAEMEFAWGEFSELQDYAEQMIKFIMHRVLIERKKELEILERDLSKLEPTVGKVFPRLTYTEVLKILKEKFNLDIEWGKDLRTVEEDKLSELYDTPIIVTDYPKKVKAFYMKETPGDSKTVQGFDVIVPEHYGELVGASQREESIEKLKENLLDQGEDPADYEFYFDTRRYGSVPHAGFGMGMERLISWVCGLDNIKDAIAFPRTMLRFNP